MTTPPCYDDLGGSAQEILNKGYHLGVFDISGRVAGKKGLEIKGNAVSNNANSKMDCSLEWSHHLEENGISFQQKAYSDKVLFSEFGIHNVGNRSADFHINHTLAPGKSLATEAALSCYQPWHNSTASYDFVSKNAILTCVLGQMSSGILVGCKAHYDLSTSKLVKNNFSLGYQDESFEMNSYVTNQTEFGADFYHKTSPNTQLAVDMGWNKSEQSTWFSIGAVHDLNPLTTLRAKFLSSSQLGLSVSRLLRAGVCLTLSTMLNTQNLGQGGHRFGAGLEVDID